MADQVIRMGIIGTGRIAKRMIPEAESVPEIRINAVYNFDKSKEIPINNDNQLIPLDIDVDDIF